MNKLLLKTLLISSVLVGSGAAVAAAHDAVLAAKVKACFEKHGKMMSMRTFKGVYDCYRVHGQSMNE